MYSEWMFDCSRSQINITKERNITWKELVIGEIMLTDNDNWGKIGLLVKF